MTKKAESIAEALWKGVVGVVTRRWRNALAWQGQQGLHDHQPEIAEVAKRIGLDLTPFAAAAAREIPEPKSWAKEAAPAKKPAKSKKSRKAA